MDYQVKETTIDHGWQVSEWWPDESNVFDIDDAIHITKEAIKLGYYDTTDPEGVIKLEIYIVDEEEGELVMDEATIKMNYRPVTTRTPINP